jgi:hypothetical protein
MRKLALVFALAACHVGAPPGMALSAPRPHAEDSTLVELARVEAQRALLVVYPRDACSGSASTVLMDEHGRFLGAIAPGTAALLDVPASASTLVAVSAVEVAAPRGLPVYVDDVSVPPLPDGLLLRSTHASARQCHHNGQYADVRRATKPELEAAIANADIHWLEPRTEAGQAWLDANRTRVREILDARKELGLR